MDELDLKAKPARKMDLTNSQFDKVGYHC